jgi:hypothetical protein
MDMAYYCFAVVVSRAVISELELRDVVGGFKERELAPIVFSIRTPPANEPGAPPTEKASPAANNKEEAIARLFGIVNELKSEPDTPASALLQSEIADVLWRFDEPGARVIFRLAFDSVRQMKIDSSSSLDAEAKQKVLREVRRRAIAIKTIVKRYGLHDRKGAQSWLQDLENDQQAAQKNSTKGSRMSVAQAELLAALAADMVRQDVNEAQRLGALSLTAESIPPSFVRLLMALRSVDKTRSDALFRQALLTMRANGLRYETTLMSLTNYEFFANGTPFPDATSTEISLITQYFVDAASAQLALMRGGAFNADEQALLGTLYSFLNSRALPVVALNAPDKLTLLQTNLAEISRRLTVEQRQAAERADSFLRQPGPDDKDADVDARIHRAEQEKNADRRDALFQNLAVHLMYTEPEKALDVARRIEDVELRAECEDSVYIVMLADAFRSGGSNENARSIALKINDKTAGAKWLAEIAVRRRSSAQAAAATALLSEAYAMAMKCDNDADKVDTLLFIGQQFLQFDRDRGFEILSDALRTANRSETKPRQYKSSTTHVVSITMVNGKERSSQLRPTFDSMDFNEVAAFAKADYFKTNSLGDSLTDHLLRVKFFMAVARSVLDVPREGSAYERSFADMFPN